MTVHQFYVVLDQAPTGSELKAMGPLQDPRLGQHVIEPDRPEPQLLDAVLGALSDVERSGRVVKRIVDDSGEKRPLIAAADLIIQLREMAGRLPSDEVATLCGLLRLDAPPTRHDSTVRPPRSSGRMGSCIAA